MRIPLLLVLTLPALYASARPVVPKEDVARARLVSLPIEHSVRAVEMAVLDRQFSWQMTISALIATPSSPAST